MKIKIKSLKKALLFALVSLQIITLNISPTLAGYIVDDIDEAFGEDLTGLVTESAKILEQRYNINQSSVKEMADYFNASPYKSLAPQVQITFTPSNPKPGDKITAMATPMYFNGTSQKMYFTWYLYRKPPTGDGIGNGANSMKKRAAKIMAFGNYEPEDKFSFLNLSGKDGNNDSYKAIFGGESDTAIKDADAPEKTGDQDGAKRCYVHNFETGENYEITCDHQFPDPVWANGKWRDVCDGDFESAEEKRWGTNPDNEDTDGDGAKDEADLCGLGQDAFTWNYKAGDKVGVIVEGTSVYPTKYGDSSFMVMWALPKNYCKPTGGNYKDIGTAPKDPDGGGSVESFEDFFQSASTELIAKAISLAVSAATQGTIKLDADQLQGILTALGIANGDNLESAIGTIRDGVVTYLDTNFPLGSGSWSQYINESTFSLEALYNLYIEDTLDAAEMDTSDRIQEGSVDYDTCLKNNLIDPAEGGNFSNVEVKISYNPKNPINDDDGDTNKTGSLLKLIASVSNVRDIKQTKFTWKFYVCPDIDSADCKIIPFSEIEEIGKTIGFGLNSVSFPLNLSGYNNLNYLKVRVTASEIFSENVLNSNTGVAYVPITSAEGQITVYSSDIDGKIGSERCTSGTGGIEGENCLATKGEKIWVKSGADSSNYNFSWIIDGQPFAPTSEECSDCVKSSGDTGKENTNVAYFIVTKGTSEIHKVNLIAENPDDGKKIDITKNFKVVNPEVTIEPADVNTVGLELGVLIKNDGTKEIDNSKETFLASGSEVKIKANLNVEYAGTLENTYWTLDGYKLTEGSDLLTSLGAKIEDGGRTLSFNNSKEYGEGYEVGFFGYYKPNSQKGFPEKLLGDTIEVKSNYSPAPTAGILKNNKILATIFTGFSSYLLFLFKVTILVSLLLFTNWIIVSFFPKLKTNYE